MKNLTLIGNWKLNGSKSSIQAFSNEWRGCDHPALTVAVAPPALYLGYVAKTVSGCLLAAQDCSAHDEGAHTGEISAAMLADWGCRYVLVGHSERREAHAESDELIGEKARKVQAAGLLPVLCVGEDLHARESGAAETVVKAQLQGALIAGQSTALLVAYEPVWAIGTGLTASPEQANDMHAMIKSDLCELLQSEQSIPVLYGGSVNPDNARALFECAHVDGALVGGASLSAESFASIARAGIDYLSH